jgi:Anti-sigma-28 factor, FlgM
MTPDRRAQRRAQRGHAPTPMNDPSMRAMHINSLKERIERSAYTVDADAVAEALLRRPSARRTILPAVSRPGARIQRANGSAPRS